jgi:tetratricopeptide (TPR) repeat protein
MAVGFALTLLAGFLVPSDACDLVVQGRYEPSAYLDAVRLYRDGNRDEARKALARLDDDEVDHFIERIDALREKFQPSALENFVPEDVCFEAACLLEAELAMAHVEAFRWNEADRHFDAGWRVSSLIDSPKRQAGFQRDWLLAVGLFHHRRIFQGQDPQAPFERADRFLQDARRRYPQDFEVLMAAGALLALSGSLPEGDRDHLKQAEALYTQALRVSPDDPEALLRHGWVLRRLGKTHEAEGPLRRVLELASEDNLIYRSRMALGGMAEREGRLNEAVADYQAAAAVEPAWQVAYLAWAEVLHRQGAHDRAREVLKRALAISPSEARNDGWWQYELGLVRLLDPLLDRMRTEVTK